MAITKSDIDLALADDVIVLGFNVRAEGQATELANREGVDVRYYTVIYQAIDEIEAALKGMLKPVYEEVQLGTAEVREVFRVPKIGNVAGSLVRSGTIVRNSKARLMRDGAVVADNLTVESLRRFKDDATEVREGYECGIGLGSFNDIKVDDVIETFEMREIPRLSRLTRPAAGGDRCSPARSPPTCCWATSTRSRASGPSSGRSWPSCGAASRCRPPRSATRTCTAVRWSASPPSRATPVR